jgi:hypothetical protein
LQGNLQRIAFAFGGFEGQATCTMHSVIADLRADHASDVSRLIRGRSAPDVQFNHNRKTKRGSMTRRRIWRASARVVMLAGTALTFVVPAAAQETATYSYDSKGRVQTVSHSGGVNDGATATYNYDNADNRTSLVVTAAAAPTCSGVSFAVANASANEGSNLSFSVTKSGTTSDTCTVNYATANGTAMSGTNYTAKSGTVSFASGTTSQTVTVATIDDHVVTGALSMYLNLSSPSGSATISDNQGVGTINNIDSSGTTTIQLTSGTSENLRTIANANGYTGSSSANYTFVVGSGVTVTGSVGSGTGIDTGSWPAGVTLALQVNGIVRGGGGTGGQGGSSGVAGGSGSAGGDAIRCTVPITITVNSGGTVQAGGGGGGGGGGTGNPQGGGYYGGGGGGGGAPNGVQGSGGLGSNGGTDGSYGSAGTVSGGGAGGSGGSPGGAGGTYAQAGVTPSASPYGAASGSGGAAGYAVRKNGTSCSASGAGTITGTVG